MTKRKLTPSQQNLSLSSNCARIGSTLLASVIATGLSFGADEANKQSREQTAPKHVTAHASKSENPGNVSRSPRDPLSLPPLPEGVSELRFEDFYRTPVGAFGLELTKKIQALDGKRVRISGYMVREENEKDDAETSGPSSPPERLMVTPVPVSISASHYGLSDDLPPQTLYATLSESRLHPVPYQKGLLLLTGKLSLGNHPEPDGRVSNVRLKLDPFSSSPTTRTNSAPGLPSHPLPPNSAPQASPTLTPTQSPSQPAR